VTNELADGAPEGAALLPATSPRDRPGIACQTYSWQMTPAGGRLRFDVIAGQIGVAGFAAVEPEVVMLGRYARPAPLNELLAAHGLRLAALCLVLDWRQGAETAEEAAAADRAIALAGSLDGAILNLCQMPGTDRADLAERQGNALRCVNEVARRASGAGLRSVFHPNSPAGSVFRTADDYDVLVAGLGDDLGFCPDLGHVAAVGMDPLSVLARYRDKVGHVHYKDVAPDGSWEQTGHGTVDFRGATEYLCRTGYDGWIVMEDESGAAEADPGGAAARNAAYAREFLLPIIDGTIGTAVSVAPSGTTLGGEQG
jgi:inosose dehydratase